MANGPNGIDNKVDESSDESSSSIDDDDDDKDKFVLSSRLLKKDGGIKGKIGQLSAGGGVNRFDLNKFVPASDTGKGGGFANNGEKGNRKDKTNVNSFICTLLAAGTTGGTTYAFGLYASALRSSLHLHVSQVETISSSFFAAGLFSFLPGAYVDSKGPRKAMIVGGSTASISFMLFWLVSTGRLAPPRWVIVPVLCGFSIGAYFGAALVTGSVFKLITACFSIQNGGSGSKGAAVGAAKGYVGLGSGAYACFFSSIRGPNWSDLDFLPMAAFFFVAVVVIPAMMLLDEGNGDENDLRGGVNKEGNDRGCESGYYLDDEDPDERIKERRRRISKPTPPEETISDVVDGTTPLHFFIVYCGLLALGSLVVWQSLHSLNDGATESGVVDGGVVRIVRERIRRQQQWHEWQQELPWQWQQRWMVENFPPISSHVPMKSNIKSSSDAIDEASRTVAGMLIGVLVLLFWFGPILCMRYLPRKREEASIDQDCNEWNTLTEYRDNPDKQHGLYDQYDYDEDDNEYGISDQDNDKGNGTFELSSIRMNSRDDEGQTSIEMEKIEREHIQNNSKIALDASSTKRSPSLSSLGTYSKPSNKDKEGSIIHNDKGISEDLTTVKMVQTLPAFLLFWTCSILIGAGTVITNHAGQMAESLSLPPSAASSSLALFSAAQALARVITGSLSEIALQNRSMSVPRPAFFVIASFAGAVAHSMLATATTEYEFVFGNVLAGLAFGMVWPLLVLVVGELWGLSHFSSNYMLYDGGSAAVGTFVLGKMVSQRVYVAHLPAEGIEGDGVCIGGGCYGATHVIVSVLCGTCVVTSLLLMYVTRARYEQFDAKGSSKECKGINRLRHERNI